MIRILDAAGQPVVGRDAVGRIKIVRHLRKGGFFGMLVDQKFQKGEILPFLGHDALTSTIPAQQALRYDLALVPFFGVRRENGFDIDIRTEDPIEHSDANTMTRQMNDRICAQILKHPDQWYWLHQRRNDVDVYQSNNSKAVSTI